MTKTASCAALLALLLGTGCATARLVDFTVLSNKRVGDVIDVSSPDDLRVVQGTSVVKTYLLFIRVGEGPSVSHALNDALQTGNGNVLVDGSIDAFSNMYFPFIYHEEGFIVSGRVVDATDSRGSPAEAPR